MPMNNDRDQNGKRPNSESTRVKSLLALLAELHPLDEAFPPMEDSPPDQTRVLL